MQCLQSTIKQSAINEVCLYLPFFCAVMVDKTAAVLAWIKVVAAVVFFNFFFFFFTTVRSEFKLDHKESWVPKNWCFWTVVLEKTLESPLDCKEIQPVYPKGNQSWMFIGRTDVEAETPVLWPPDTKSWVIWKDPDVGKDWRQEEKGTTAGAGPRQDPGEPSGWTATARERHVGPALIGPSLLGRERERDETRPGICSRVWRLLYFSP